MGGGLRGAGQAEQEAWPSHCTVTQGMLLGHRSHADRCSFCACENTSSWDAVVSKTGVGAGAPRAQGGLQGVGRSQHLRFPTVELS